KYLPFLKPLTTFSTKYAVKDRARIIKKRHFIEVAFFIGNDQYEFGVNLFRKNITPSALIEFKPDRLLFML
ncbi:MAG: hypothetical protein ACI81C_003203, partial [Alteromonas macleodii]